VGTSAILKSDVARAGAITGDLSAAASALLERSVLRKASPYNSASVLAAERAIVRDQFGGSTARYHAALAAAHASLADARAIIGDRLARARVEERFKPPAATAEQISDFLTTYAATQVRLVSSQTEAPWLGDAFRGFAVQSIAPDRVFTLPQGKATAIDTIDGRFTVKPLGPALPLYALAPTSARAVARGMLGRFAREGVFTRWLQQQENALLQTALCARDDVPAPGDVDLSAWLPFLAGS
jgi:hypothetical protein